MYWVLTFFAVSIIFISNCLYLSSIRSCFFDGWHISKNFSGIRQCRSRCLTGKSPADDCEKPFAEGVATADASAERQNLITAKGDVL